MNRFENKAVIITGAAGGIGEATTRRIVSEGGKVVIADHSKEKAEQLNRGLTYVPFISPLPNCKAAKS